MNFTTIGLTVFIALLAAATAYTTLDRATADKIKLYHIARKPETDSPNFNTSVSVVPALLALVGILAGCAVNAVLKNGSLNLYSGIRLFSALVFLSGAAGNDLREKRIPNIFPLVMTLIALGTHTAAYFGELNGENTEFFGSLIAALVVGLGLVLVSFLTKQGIGMGDVKLVSALALECGVFLFCRVLFFSMVWVAVVAVLLLLTKLKKLSDSLPFAPFLFLGFVTALLTISL